MTVLIVEDNAGVRRLLRRAMERIATEVWECEDGSHALANYRDHAPDLVLMDVRMPIMDGLAAVKQIRRFDPVARIIMVTDYDDEELRLAASGAGAWGYTLKQNLTGLEALVAQALECKRT